MVYKGNNQQTNKQIVTRHKSAMTVIYATDNSQLMLERSHSNTYITTHILNSGTKAVYETRQTLATGAYVPGLQNEKFTENF